MEFTKYVISKENLQTMLKEKPNFDEPFKLFMGLFQNTYPYVTRIFKGKYGYMAETTLHYICMTDFHEFVIVPFDFDKTNVCYFLKNCKLNELTPFMKKLEQGNIDLLLKAIEISVEKR